MRKVVKLRRGLSQLEEILRLPNAIYCSIAFFDINIPIKLTLISPQACQSVAQCSQLPPPFCRFHFGNLECFLLTHQSFSASPSIIKMKYIGWVVILNQTKSVKWLWRCCYWQHWRHKVAYWSRNWQFLEQTEIDNIWHRHRMFHR